MPDKQLLTTRQLARRWHVNVSTVFRWVAAGRLEPEMRLPNGQLLFDADYIDNLPLVATWRWPERAS